MVKNYQKKIGLDISHYTWHGAYSAFHRWRKTITEVSGLGNLEDYEGFSEKTDAIKFDKKHPLTPLLYHSDCDGYINWSKLKGISDFLKTLLPKLQELDGGGHIGNYADKTKIFIQGCDLAYYKKEKLLFR